MSSGEPGSWSCVVGREVSSSQGRMFFQQLGLRPLGLRGQIAHMVTLPPDTDHPQNKIRCSIMDDDLPLGAKLLQSIISDLGNEFKNTYKMSPDLTIIFCAITQEWDVHVRRQS